MFTSRNSRAFLTISLPQVTSLRQSPPLKTSFQSTRDPPRHANLASPTLTPCQPLPSGRKGRVRVSKYNILAARLPFRIGLFCHLTHSQHQVQTGLGRRGQGGQGPLRTAWKAGHGGRKGVSHVLLGFHSQIKQSAKEM